MGSFDAQMWQEYAQVYAFVGNSLLKPLSQTESVGLDPAFWEAFPTFNDDAVMEALAELASYVAACGDGGARAIQDVSVEYTRLFVGPPKPAAPPWETMYRGESVSVGFGQATFDMRTLLREAGLEVKNENNQYEDHLGIELLYLATLCSRAAAGEELNPASIAAFIDKHLLSWIEAFRARVSQAAPGGYYAKLIALAQAMLIRHRTQLSV